MYRHHLSSTGQVVSNTTVIISVIIIIYIVDWTVPVVTGTIPPIAYCTLNVLPSQDKAILFGGGVVDGLLFRPTNSVYILTLMKNQVVRRKCTI